MKVWLVNMRGHAPPINTKHLLTSTRGYVGNALCSRTRQQRQRLPQDSNCHVAGYSLDELLQDSAAVIFFFLHLNAKGDISSLLMNLLNRPGHLILKTLSWRNTEVAVTKEGA